MAARHLDVAAVLDLGARRRPGGRRLTLQLASEHVTLREVITRAVEIEVRRHEAREEAALGELLIALFGDDSTTVAAWGPPSSLVAETERALQGFRDGSYRVLLDGRPVTALEERLVIGLRSEVSFVRVLPLVSG